MATLGEEGIPLFMDTRHVERYWQLVEEALAVVFDHSDMEPLRRLKDIIAGSAWSEQILFFHSDPLTVARRLAGESNRPLSDRHYERYQYVRRRTGFAEAEADVEHRVLTSPG
jgi:hypothetical protein